MLYDRAKAKVKALKYINKLETEANNQAQCCGARPSVSSSVNKEVVICLFASLPRVERMHMTPQIC